jgi:hypothetical protein
MAFTFNSLPSPPSTSIYTPRPGSVERHRVNINQMRPRARQREKILLALRRLSFLCLPLSLANDIVNGGKLKMKLRKYSFGDCRTTNSLASPQHHKNIERREKLFAAFFSSSDCSPPPPSSVVFAVSPFVSSYFFCSIMFIDSGSEHIIK